MVIYYTGTGNSRHLAELAAQQLGQELVSAPELMKKGETGSLASDEPWLFVSPTYGWQLPRIFGDFIRRSSFSGSKDAYFIMDCGTEIGNAAKGLKALCSEKGFNFRGVAQINMPENYIAVFSAPTEEQEKKIIRIGEHQLKRVIALIQKNEDLPEPPVKLKDKLASGIINAAFYKFIIGDKKFYTTDKCVGCGKCAQSCVLNNITLENGKPVWHGNCTHCMACICGCPTEAIEYGKHSVGLRRYYLK
jgi:ferredoxin